MYIFQITVATRNTNKVQSNTDKIHFLLSGIHLYPVHNLYLEHNLSDSSSDNKLPLHILVVQSKTRNSLHICIVL